MTPARGGATVQWCQFQAKVRTRPVVRERSVRGVQRSTGRAQPADRVRAGCGQGVDMVPEGCSEWHWGGRRWGCRESRQRGGKRGRQGCSMCMELHLGMAPECFWARNVCVTVAWDRKEPVQEEDLKGTRRRGGCRESETLCCTVRTHPILIFLPISCTFSHTPHDVSQA